VPIRVITDSTAALDPVLAAANDVTVVPVRINIGEHSYGDGEISLADMVARVGEGIRTSGPAPGAFAEAVAAVPDGAVVITVASTLSSTHRSAGVAAAETDREIRMVDSGTAAGAQAIVALHAASVAAAGAGIDEVAAAAGRAASEVRLFGLLQTLDYLVRGGRVSGLLGAVAGTLRVRPIFELREGRIRRHRPALGSDAGIERLVGALQRSRIPDARLHCVAQHTMAKTRAEQVLARVAEFAEPSVAFVSEFGAPMAAHTGPGMVGLSWWWEQPR
jgi:DegV family protein with EDD domain